MALFRFAFPNRPPSRAVEASSALDALKPLGVGWESITYIQTLRDDAWVPAEYTAVCDFRRRGRNTNSEGV
jgi:hypothetical protein